MSSIAIIVINYNSTRLTKKCIQSLFAHKDKEDVYHVIVWDNNSTNPPTSSDFPNCELVLSPTNDGFALGNNKAVHHILHATNRQCDYILILNNDTRVPRGMVHNLVKGLQSNVSFGCVTPKIYFEKGYEYYSKEYQDKQKGKVIWYGGGGIDWANLLFFHTYVDEVDRGQLDKPQETAFATGCCFLTTPAIWNKLKGFDTEYFMYYEDVDWSIRLKQKLHKTIAIIPSAHLYHLNAGSTGGSGSSFHMYYQTRNRLRFGLHYAPVRSKLALLKEALRLYKHGSDAQKQGVSHALEGKWGNQHQTVQ